MEILKKNKFTFLLVAFVIIGVALIYQYSYAKYVKGVEGDVDLNMASWNIYVNNESILGKQTLSNTLVAYFPETDYRKANVIAPGAIGYFDIKIDPTRVDVAFSYEINIECAIASLTDIKITSYEILNQENSETEVDGALTGTMPLNSSAKTLRIYVEWIDNEDETMDNADDTNVATTYRNIPFNVDIRFIQLTN